VKEWQRGNTHTKDDWLNPIIIHRTHGRTTCSWWTRGSRRWPPRRRRSSGPSRVAGRGDTAQALMTLSAVTTCRPCCLRGGTWVPPRSGAAARRCRTSAGVPGAAAGAAGRRHGALAVAAPSGGHATFLSFGRRGSGSSPAAGGSWIIAAVSAESYYVQRWWSDGAVHAFAWRRSEYAYIQWHGTGPPWVAAVLEVRRVGDQVQVVGQGVMPDVHTADGPTHVITVSKKKEKKEMSPCNWSYCKLNCKDYIFSNQDTFS